MVLSCFKTPSRETESSFHARHKDITHSVAHSCTLSLLGHVSFTKPLKLGHLGLNQVG